MSMNKYIKYYIAESKAGRHEKRNAAFYKWSKLRWREQTLLERLNVAAGQPAMGWFRFGR
jgi:hypothetical protein